MLATDDGGRERSAGEARRIVTRPGSRVVRGNGEQQRYRRCRRGDRAPGGVLERYARRRLC